MMEFIISIVLLFILWLICNYILKILLNKYLELNDYTIAALEYRKTIMFDIFVLIFIFIFNFKIIRYIAVLYYVIIVLIEGILIIIATVSGLEDDIKNKKIEKNLWLLLSSKFLNEIASIIMILALFNLNY